MTSRTKTLALPAADLHRRSLLLGARLAEVFEDRDKAASLGLQLKRLYPASQEYQQYQSGKQ